MSTLTNVTVPVPVDTNTVVVHWHVNRETFKRLLPAGVEVREFPGKSDIDAFRSAHFEVDGCAVIMYGSDRIGVRITVDTTEKGWQE